MKKFIVDTLLGVIFWFIVMMFFEIIVLSMTIGQSFITRCGAIIINSLTTGLNALFIDWFRKITKANQGDIPRKFLLDTIGTVIFQLPVYIIILTTSHAVQFLLNGNWDINKYLVELKWAVTFLPLVFLSIGGLYGVLLNKTRKLFKVTVL
jgi:hypothetical protein